MKLEVLAWIDFVHFERKVRFLERYAETIVKIGIKGRDRRQQCYK